MNILRFDSIDSTNEEARRRVAAGEGGPLWITANVQTAGRGRRGRNWISEPGNLFASLLLTPPGSIEHRAQLSFVAGLAAATCVSVFAEYQDNVRLKWPNDVLVNEKKVAGVLLESFGNALVVGFGINLGDYPRDTDFPATSIGQCSPGQPEPEETLTILMNHWEHWHGIFQRDDFAPIRSAWLARAHGMGERIRVRLMDRELNGVFEDLDSDGALLLREPSGLTRITAGDVFFGE